MERARKEAELDGHTLADGRSGPGSRRPGLRPAAMTWARRSFAAIRLSPRRYAGVSRAARPYPLPRRSRFELNSYSATIGATRRTYRYSDRGHERQGEILELPSGAVLHRGERSR